MQIFLRSYKVIIFTDVSNFNVFIGDTNDNKPTFENESYQAEVNENEDKGHLVVIIKAYDEDECKTEHIFHICNCDRMSF